MAVHAITIGNQWGVKAPRKIELWGTDALARSLQCSTGAWAGERRGAPIGDAVAELAHENNVPADAHAALVDVLCFQQRPQHLQTATHTVGVRGVAPPDPHFEPCRSARRDKSPHGHIVSAPAPPLAPPLQAAGLLLCKCGGGWMWAAGGCSAGGDAAGGRRCGPLSNMNGPPRRTT